MKTRALGTAQAAFLKAVIQHGGFWHEKCGCEKLLRSSWDWESPRTTIRLCEVLERRGLLRRKGLDAYWYIEDKTMVERALKAVEPRKEKSE